MAKLLTKSKYMNGLESDALLWMAVNDKESLPKVDDATQAKFDAGKEIEILARKMFEGVDLSECEFKENLAETKKYVSQRQMIFEAGFMIENLYSRSDIVIPNNEDSWDLIEIKGSTKVKESHVKDLAFQKHVLELAGLKVRDCYVIHLNRDYVRGDFLDIGLLFKKSEVTKRVEQEILGMEERIERMFEVINLPECPMFDYKDILRSEYGNYLIDEFHESLPEHSVFELYGIRADKATDLIDEGKLLITDLSEDFSYTKIQRIQRDSIINKKIHVQKEDIESFISSLEYPIHYLDFETMMPPIPLFKNSRSYDQIPFQYSLHKEKQSGEIEHKEFLYEGKQDPRHAFLENLKKDLEGAGTILVYNESFEIHRLKEMARLFPDESSWLEETINKIADLIIPFKTFSYYDPEQRGSCSLKTVLPLFHNKTYDSLRIKEGGDASRTYMSNFGEITPETKKDLLAYCELDTEGMISILKGLKEITKKSY